MILVYRVNMKFPKGVLHHFLFSLAFISQYKMVNDSVNDMFIHSAL